MNWRPARDERERAIDAEAERLVAIVLSFGLLVLVMVRSLRGEAAWDLLALVIVSGAVGTVYRARNRVVDRRTVATMLAAGLVAAIAAVVFVLIVSLTVR